MSLLLNTPISVNTDTIRFLGTRLFQARSLNVVYFAFGSGFALKLTTSAPDDGDNPLSGILGKLKDRETKFVDLVPEGEKLKIEYYTNRSQFEAYLRTDQP